jgi:phage terminase large subunit GpA-like protein
VKVFAIQPSAFKDVLFARLRKMISGPGYLHFGMEAQTRPDDYFTQYEAEKRRVVWKGLKPVVVYENLAKKRNEAIDHYVGNLAALRSFGLHTSEQLGVIAAEVQAEGHAIRAAEPTSAPAADAPDGPRAQPAAPIAWTTAAAAKQRLCRQVASLIPAFHQAKEDAALRGQSVPRLSVDA